MSLPIPPLRPPLTPLPSGRGRRHGSDGSRQWCVTVCYVDPDQKQPPHCNRYCLRRELKSNEEKHWLAWEHRWFLRFLRGTPACLRDEAGAAKPTVMTREERDRRAQRREVMPDDYQYEIIEPWLATDIYMEYGKHMATGVFTPVWHMGQRYKESWENGTQQRILWQFYQRALEGEAFRIAWRGAQRMAELWRERDQ
ncbi:hypothetical protein BDF19DRAFT_452340 [Syncephalis fuscata]|nr:hypothetical protein BDF19DRAFT_452340 [Syncephalis fuscata]